MISRVVIICGRTSLHFAFLLYTSLLKREPNLVNMGDLS